MTRKPVQVFLLHAAFCLALLSLTAFSGARETYPLLFHVVGNELMEDLGDGHSVRLQSVDPAKRPDSADTRMLGRDRGRLEYSWKAVYNSHWRLFWPSVTLVALLIPTPMSRLRLAWVIPVGLLLFNAIFLLEVLGLASVLFGTQTEAAAGKPSTWAAVLPVAKAMFNSPITNFSVVFFLWAWLARPGRSLDLDALNASMRRVMAQPPPLRAAPPADAPPAEAAAAPESEEPH